MIYDDTPNAVARPYRLPSVIHVLLSMPTNTSSSVYIAISRANNNVVGYYILREEYQPVSSVEHYHFLVGDLE
eukprot:scaffold12895_cov164-Skeletonema_dohrnii-CCMP3373.AAC.3